MRPEVSADQAQRFLTAALEGNLPPVDPDYARCKSIVIRVSQHNLGLLAQRYGEINKNERNALLSRLIEAGRTASVSEVGVERVVAPDEAVAVLDAVLAGTGRTSRAAQRTLALSAGQHVRQGGVLLCEAPTGSGKTLGYLSAAIAAIRAGRAQRAVIAVPTIALARQVAAELARAYDALTDPPSWMVVRGSGQFVSQHALQSVIDAGELAEDSSALARDWMQAQMDKDADDRWDVSSLAALDLGLPAVHVTGFTADDDPGRMAWREQMEQAQGKRILITTHAMLCIDALRRRGAAKRNLLAEGQELSLSAYQQAKAAGDTNLYYGAWLAEQLSSWVSETPDGPLPAYDLLVVDEAHQIEEAMAGVASQGVSLWSLLGEADLTETARKALRAGFEAMRSYGQAHPDLERAPVQAHPALGQAISELLKALSRLRHKHAAVQRAIQALQMAVRYASVAGFVSEVDFSRVYRYPTISVGPRNVQTHLEYLWRSVRCTLALSATVMLPRVGQMLPSDAYIRSRLALPVGTQTISLPPAAWLTEPVRMALAPAGSPKPPDVDQREIHIQTWCEEVATFMHRHVLGDAAGGTLVLCTSYSQVEALAGALQSMLEERPVIAAVRGQAFARQFSAFTEAASRRSRPVWLGLGAAWTGLDVVAPTDASQDSYLTDLVIPRLPFGTNRSLTHQHRVDRMGFAIEMQEMLLALKQGVGRLVRREGVRNRRLWIIDGRLREASTTYTQSVRLLLKDYAPMSTLSSASPASNRG